LHGRDRPLEVLRRCAYGACLRRTRASYRCSRLSHPDSPARRHHADGRRGPLSTVSGLKAVEPVAHAGRSSAIPFYNTKRPTGSAGQTRSLCSSPEPTAHGERILLINESYPGAGLRHRLCPTFANLTRNLPVRSSTTGGAASAARPFPGGGSDYLGGAG
jgi:hypothetical protein